MYFRDKLIPQRIHSFDPSIKLLLVVKDPIRRALSHYLHFFKDHHKSFAELITDNNGEISTNTKVIDLSLYHKYFKHWLSVFKSEQIHIVDGDNLAVNPAEEFGRIEGFLNLDRYFTENKFYFNKTKGFYCLKTERMKHIFCTGGGKVRFDKSIETTILENRYTKMSNTSKVASIVSKLRKFFKPHNLIFFNITGNTYNWESTSTTSQQSIKQLLK